MEREQLRREIIFVFFVIIFLHATYVALSYDGELLAALDPSGSPIIIERVLMLLQFAPLIITMCNRRLSRNRLLLFAAFAICINTLYIVSDFQDGVYAATVASNSGLMPRMRVSAQMMAYKDLGRLVYLDYHAEYFLEFLMVHFVSEVAGLNYVLAYMFIIRVFSIISWSVLFLWASNIMTKTHPHRQLWLLLLALSILLANQGYNAEVSFGPLLLLTLYLILVSRPLSKEFTLSALMVVMATLLASFRETLIFASICLVAVLISRVMGRIRPSSSLTRAPSLILVLLVLFLGRVFQFSSYFYIESYINKLLALGKAFQNALSEGFVLKGQPLVTVTSIVNPIDRSLALISVVSSLSFMFFLVILSLRHLLRGRNFDALSFSILFVQVLALGIPVSGYVPLIIAGSGSMLDFSSSTVLARSLAPLVVLTITSYHLRNKNRKNARIKMTKYLTFLGLIYLSFSIAFAPFWFIREEVKSSYDMVHIVGDRNEYVVTSTGTYNFITSDLTQSEKITISPSGLPRVIHFFLLYYGLPLEYRLGKDRVILTKTPMGVPRGGIYDNGRYTLAFCYSYGLESLWINQSAGAQWRP